LSSAITDAYGKLYTMVGRDQVDVAVRSSATAEDLPTASFAGQQETFLNVTGESALLQACRGCFVSLFTERAMAYREAHGLDHLKVALSVGLQQMVRSDKAGAGVLFTIDTETGFPNVVLINAAWGLGENVGYGNDSYIFDPFGSEAVRSDLS
jgi:pyruvate,water dikinase